MIRGVKMLAVLITASAMLVGNVQWIIFLYSHNSSNVYNKIVFLATRQSSAGSLVVSSGWRFRGSVYVGACHGLQMQYSCEQQRGEKQLSTRGNYTKQRAVSDVKNSFHHWSWPCDINENLTAIKWNSPHPPLCSLMSAWVRSNMTGYEKIFHDDWQFKGCENREQSPTFLHVSNWCGYQWWWHER